MLKLKNVYEMNPKKGDLNEVNNALARNAVEINQLQVEVDKFKVTYQGSVSMYIYLSIFWLGYKRLLY